MGASRRAHHQRWREAEVLAALCCSCLLTVGYLRHSRVDDVPRIVKAMRFATAPAERSVEDATRFDLRRVEEPPPRATLTRRAHRTAELVDQQPFDAFLHSVVVWFGEACTAVVANLYKALAFDRTTQYRLERYRVERFGRPGDVHTDIDGQRPEGSQVCRTPRLGNEDEGVVAASLPERS